MGRALPAVAITGLTLLTGGLAAAGPPDTYSAAEIRGWVVDAETKQPLEGVHVVAHWILYTVVSPFQMHRGQGAPLQIMEAVTDAKGEYYFPPWGPKPRGVFSHLSDSAPRLTYFKPGYRALDRGNSHAPNHDSLRTSRWHQKTIVLDPFRGTPEDWAEQLRHVQSRLEWGEDIDHVIRRLNDYWRHAPRTVLAVLNERRFLPEQLRYRVLDLDAWSVTERELRAALEEKGHSP